MTYLRLITYNFWLRPPGISDSLAHGDFKNERMKEFLRCHLSKYDVLCFQEFFGTLSKRRSSFIASAAAAGYPYSYCGPSGGFQHGLCNFKPVDGGLLIVSRFPLKSCDSLVYQNGCGSDELAAKGVLYCRIELSRERSLHLFVTHLQANYQGTENWNVQQEQLQELNEYMLEKRMGCSYADPVLLVGDMNIAAQNKEHYDAMCRILLDPVDMLAQRMPQAITYPATQQRLDYVFDVTNSLSDGSTVWVDPVVARASCSIFQHLSDHSAVCVCLQLRDTAWKPQL